MGVFDKLEKAKGGYIFLSHSHADIAQVRKIRNHLEKIGFEPLCFYLKCLDDDCEIEDLIKREIDAREWFVFVDSENSRKSKWVALEREYITRTNCKKILSVEADDPRSVRNLMHKIRHNLRIYLLHSGVDYPVARRIQKKLQEKDYLVYTGSENPNAGTSSAMRWHRRSIAKASKEGCVIALLSKRSVQSVYTKYLILYARQKRANIIPVVLGDVQFDDDLKYYLRNRPQYHLSPCPTDDEIDEMIDQIGRSIVR